MTLGRYLRALFAPTWSNGFIAAALLCQVGEGLRAHDPWAWLGLSVGAVSVVGTGIARILSLSEESP